jgi:fumarate reductase subunit C
MTETQLYIVQRLSALVMVPLVLGHIAVMIVAVQGGLSAEEILSRTQGSGAWAAFYGTFVVAVSLHAAIGLRNVLGEWAGLGPRARDLVSAALAALFLAMGARAVYSVTVVPL